MGGVDKGLVLFQQKPLIAHVIARLASQVNEIMINANREVTLYQTFGLPVLQDIRLDNEPELQSLQPDFIGPLAGFSLGLQHAPHDYLLTVPCDSPLIPLNLADRLMNALVQANAEIAVAKSDGDSHPVFSLCKKSALPSLTAYIRQGGRKVSSWQKTLSYTEVDFSDCSDAFVNINTFEELATLSLKYSSQEL